MRVWDTSQKRGFGILPDKLKPTRRSAEVLRQGEPLFQSGAPLPMLASTLFPTTITVKNVKLPNSPEKRKTP